MSTAAMLVSIISISVVADEDHHPGQDQAETSQTSTAGGPMSGMMGQQGQMPMKNRMMNGPERGMPMMQMMQQKQAMMQEHVKNTERHLANIEALLKQLVELQKK
jgi:hypothetical protein